MARRWTAEEKADLQELLSEATDPIQIAQRLNRTVPGITSQMTKLKLKSPWRPSRPSEALDSKSKNTAWVLYQEGSTVAAISSKLGFKYRVLYSHIRDMERNKIKNVKWNTFDKKVQDNIIELRSNGVEWHQIYAQFPQYNKSNLWKIFARHQERLRLRQQPYVRDWSPQDEALLLHLRQDLQLSFPEIQKQLPGRSTEALALRCYVLSGRRSKLEKYKLHELETIAKLRAEQVPWKEVDDHVSGRSPTSLRNVYSKRIKGHFSIATDGSVRWSDHWLACHARALS